MKIIRDISEQISYSHSIAHLAMFCITTNGYSETKRLVVRLGMLTWHG